MATYANAARLPVRRGLTETDASLYLGLDLDRFRNMVQNHKMPRPRLAEGKRVWNIDELDAAFLNLPAEGENIKDTWADFDGGNQA